MKSKEKKISIFGTGVFGRETLCCLIDSISSAEKKEEDVAVFMVNQNLYKETEVMGVPVITPSSFQPYQFNVVVDLGDPIARKSIVESLPIETTYTSIIHPSVAFSRWVKFGEGRIIIAGAILTYNIVIGKNAQLNLHTTIGHDCTILDYFTSAPAVNVSGNCKPGEFGYFETNAYIKQRTSVTNNVTFGILELIKKN
jgi:bifunctional N-acetylglucosamine-1-phosphate-uridyltransferase/glucosamine-1-phosphate-acetyltransferase GlmU-like protein